MSKFISILILLAAGYGVFLFYQGKLELPGTNNSTQQKGPPAGEMAMPVKTVEVSTQSFSRELNTVGTLTSDESASIRPEISGRITAIFFAEGKTVLKDDILLKIDDSIAKSELQQAEASYELNKLTFDRINELQKKGATSIQSRDEAYAKFRESEAILELAKTRLEKSTIRAPFEGMAGLREVSEGDYVETGQIITYVEAIDPIKIEFSVPEKFFADIKLGQSVFISVDAYKGKEFEGAIFAIDPKVDPETRNIRIKASAANSEALLRPGMFAYVTIRLGKKEDAILIPEEAIIPSGKGSSVYKVIDGKAVLTDVETGLRNKAMVEIIQGLSAGDEIITAGQMKIRDGMPVSTSMPEKGQK